jgi:hypothetical protein
VGHPRPTAHPVTARSGIIQGTPWAGPPAKKNKNKTDRRPSRSKPRYPQDTIRILVKYLQATYSMDNPRTKSPGYPQDICRIPQLRNFPNTEAFQLRNLPATRCTRDASQYTQAATQTKTTRAQTDTSGGATFIWDSGIPWFCYPRQPCTMTGVPLWEHAQTS